MSIDDLADHLEAHPGANVMAPGLPCDSATNSVQNDSATNSVQNESLYQGVCNGVQRRKKAQKG